MGRIILLVIEHRPLLIVILTKVSFFAFVGVVTNKRDDCELKSARC
jgi:hypothetical protein